MDFNWIKLKNECPLDIEELCNLGDEIEENLDLLEEWSDEKKYEKIQEARKNVEVFTGILVSKLHSTLEEKKQADMVIFLKFKDNLARCLKRIDLIVYESRGITPISITEFYNSVSVLFESLYMSIKKAIDDCKKDKDTSKGFLYSLYCILNTQMGVLGSEARDLKRKTTDFSSTDVTPIKQELMSEEGQENLTKDYPDIKELIKSDKGLKNGSKNTKKN